MKTLVQDGAFSWLLCFASFFNNAVQGGFIFTSGMFYILFKDSLDVEDSEASLLASLNFGVRNCVCPFAGIAIGRFGIRPVAIIGALSSTTGLALTAFSTKISHMYLCYGVITGVGFGMVHVSSIMVLGAYFKRHKRVAATLALAGLGAGSFVMPSILDLLENIYGWRGALLLLAGINVHTLVACSLYRPFEGFSQRKQKHQPKENIISNSKRRSFRNSAKSWLTENATSFNRKGLEILSLFRITPFICLIICSVIMPFAQSIIVSHFGNYILTLHFTSQDVVNLYSTLGVSGTVARPIAGVIAEFTHVNTALYIMLTFLLNGAMTIFLPFLNQLWMMFVYAAMYQLLHGPYNGLGAVIVMEHVPEALVATAYGLYHFPDVPGNIIGAPIGSWMYDYTRVYAHPFYLAGGLLMLCGLTMAPAAYHIHRKPCGPLKKPQEE